MESIDPDPLQPYLLVLLDSALPVITGGVWAGFAAILVLLALSALTSLAEVAFFSLTPGQLHEMNSREDNAGRAVQHLLETPKKLLATLLIGNSFFNVSIVIISTILTSILVNFQTFPYWAAFLLQVVAVSAIILLLGEILPKIYAARHSLAAARYLAGPVMVLTRLFYPLSTLMVRYTGLIDRRISRKVLHGTPNGVADAHDLSTREENPGDEQKMMQGIARFSDIEVKEIMRSRLDVTAVDISTSYFELLKTIIDSGYSRIPAYDGNFDQVSGILYIKDLLPHLNEKEDFRWDTLLREPFFIPENKRISDLLQEFQQKKIHMAIVVDEYGGTAGIVTLEDIIEEIVGEISDEHDAPVGDVEFSRLDERSFIFEGKTSLNDFCKIVGIDDDTFDEVKGESDSLAGLLLELFEKMPEKGEKTEYGQFLFTVKVVDKRRIKKILVTLKEEEED